MKRFKDQLVYLLVSVFLFTGLAFAESPHGVSHVGSLWVGDRADTADVTPGENDVFVSGTAEVDGAVRIDGAIDANSTANIEGAVTLQSTLDTTGAITSDAGISGTTGTFSTAGSLDATEIADVQRSFPLYLPAGMEDGGNDLDDASTPTLTEVDNVPCLQWDDSTETTAAQWTFRLPPDFVASGACGLYAIISSGAAEAVALDYAWWINGDDITFDAAAVAQDICAATGTYLDVSCEELDLSANSTAIAAFTAGTWVTAEVFNSAVTDTVGKVELKGLEFYYQSNQ